MGAKADGSRSLVNGTLGQFEVKEEIARGGMGVVYKGYQPSLDRWVAIKTLPLEFSGDRDLVSRFHREAEAMVRLNHANIVQIIDRGQDQGHYYFAMEFVEGPSIKDLLKSPTIDAAKIFDILVQTCEGLEYAHKKGIVHRDVKPANLLYEDKTGTVKIADFGIARLLKKDADMLTLTADNVGMGTMNYMAPEQKTNAKEVDHRADIYALGVIVYEAFTGKLPLGKFKLPSELNAKLPRKLDVVVQKCLESEPEDRFQSCAELKAMLGEARAAAASSGTLVRTVRDAAERTMTAFGSNKTAAVVVLGALGVVFLVGVVGVALLVRAKLGGTAEVAKGPAVPGDVTPGPTPPGEPRKDTPGPTPPGEPRKDTPGPTPDGTPAPLVVKTDPPAPAPSPVTPTPAPSPVTPTPVPPSVPTAPPVPAVSVEDASAHRRSLEEAKQLERELADALAAARGAGKELSTEERDAASTEIARGESAGAPSGTAELRAAIERLKKSRATLLAQLDTAVKAAQAEARTVEAETNAREAFAAAEQAARFLAAGRGTLAERTLAHVRAADAFAKAIEEAGEAVQRRVDTWLSEAAVAREAAAKRTGEGDPALAGAEDLFSKAKAASKRAPATVALLLKAVAAFDGAEPPTPKRARRADARERDDRVYSEPFDAIAANEDGVFVLSGASIHKLDAKLDHLTMEKVAPGDGKASGLAATRSYVYTGVEAGDSWEVRRLRSRTLKADADPIARQRDVVLDLAADPNGRIYVLSPRTVHVYRWNGRKEDEPKHIPLGDDFKVARSIAALPDGRFAVTVNTGLGDEPDWAFRTIFYTAQGGGGRLEQPPFDGPAQVSAVAAAGSRLLGTDHRPLSRDDFGGWLCLFPQDLRGEPERLNDPPAKTERGAMLSVLPVRLAAFGRRAYMLDQQEQGIRRNRILAFELR